MVGCKLLWPELLCESYIASNHLYMPSQKSLGKKNHNTTKFFHLGKKWKILNKLTVLVYTDYINLIIIQWKLMLQTKSKYNKNSSFGEKKKKYTCSYIMPIQGYIVSERVKIKISFHFAINPFNLIIKSA
jgi:hypothetical protein